MFDQVGILALHRPHPRLLVGREWEWEWELGKLSLNSSGQPKQKEGLGIPGPVPGLHSRAATALAHRAALSCPGPSSLACGAVQAWASPACLPQPNERSTATAPQQQQHHPPPCPVGRGRQLQDPFWVPRSPLPVRTPRFSFNVFCRLPHSLCLFHSWRGSSSISCF